jgi:glycosyltransferase involved in cell wall biosynthesis
MPILHGIFAKYALRNRLYISFHGTDVSAVRQSRLLQLLIRRANVICVVSDTMRADLEAIAPQAHILYTPNGVDNTAFPVGIRSRMPIICMVGSLRWQKDYPTALEAFARFRERFHEWGLAIIGEGPDRGLLEKQCARLGIESSVSFMGGQSRHQVSELMRDSRIFMLSSVSEGFPKVILEAASSGTPLVVTDVGNCRDVAENARGLVVPPQQPQDLAGALARLASDPEAWERASAQGPRTAQAFSWGTTAGILMGSYASNDDI